MDSNSNHPVPESICYCSWDFKNISSVKKLKKNTHVSCLAGTGLFCCILAFWQSLDSHTVVQGSANFFWEVSDRKYCKRYGPYRFCCNYSIMHLCMKLATDNT